MNIDENDILKVTRELYPTGLAYNMAVGSVKEKMHKALGVSESAARNSALSLLDSILPDNVNFTEENAASWEKKLGIVSNSLTLLEDRKEAILRKMQHPGTIAARQHYLYIQGELQKAGFDVYVHENRFPSGSTYTTQTPEVIIGIAGKAVHSPLIQHGQVQHGGGFKKQVVNSIYQNLDVTFNIGTPEDERLRATFFIGGVTVGDFADIPQERETEFRQLILKLKPVHTLAYLFINYI